MAKDRADYTGIASAISLEYSVSDYQPTCSMYSRQSFWKFCSCGVSGRAEVMVCIFSNTYSS